ncbi:hypothetical protein ACYSNX_01290 [Myroides sp. LJL115]
MNQRFKILTPMEQLLFYLENTPKEKIRLLDLKNEISSHLDLFNLLDFLGSSSGGFLWKYGYESFVKEILENQVDKFIAYLDKLSMELSSTHFLCKILYYKNQLINRLDFIAHRSGSNVYKIVNGTFLMDSLNDMLFKELFSLKQVVTKNEISVGNYFALLLEENPKEGINRFRNYIYKEIYNKQSLNHIEQLILSKDLFFKYLQLDFIPSISFSNYKENHSLFLSENALLTKKEVEQILGQNEYFKKHYPLFELSQQDLFSKCSDFNAEKIKYTENTLYDFFQFISKEKFFYKNTNIYELFLSSCTESYPSFSKDELYYAHQTLNDLVSLDKSVFNYIIAIFIFLKNSDSLKNVSSKLPLILNTYFKGNSLSLTTIKQYITREDKSSKTFLKECNYINDLAISFEKKRQDTES